MPRSDLNDRFEKIDTLVSEINTIAPANSSFNITVMRADLAGLLVVAIAATYESCVKDVMFNYANKRHSDFGQYASRSNEKLSSRIRVNHLCEYCGLFDPEKKVQFASNLRRSRQRISAQTGKNIETSYDQILNWRHDFAHSWNRNTTIEEAVETHRFAKRIIYLFDRTMNSSPPQLVPTP